MWGVWLVVVGPVIVGLAAGLLFRRLGFVVPILYSVVLWIVEDSNGAFVNPPGAGENRGAEAGIAYFTGIVLGTLAVALALTARRLASRVTKTRRHTQR